MLDIKFIRENPDLVKENIRKKFQNAKLPLVDEVIALDSERREAINEGEALKAERNKISKANGPLFGKLKKCADEAEKAAQNCPSVEVKIMVGENRLGWHDFDIQKELRIFSRSIRQLQKHSRKLEKAKWICLNSSMF